MGTVYEIKASITSCRMCTYALVTEKKSADLQGTLKVHLRLYNKISRLHRPRNEIWHAHFLCMYAVWL